MPFVRKAFLSYFLLDYRPIQSIQLGLVAPFPAPVAVVVALKPAAMLLGVVTSVIVMFANGCAVK
ncbi:hypothetical protein D9M69_681980 [compost metagenome]